MTVKCVICDSPNTYEAFNHTYWEKPVHLCRTCGHSALYYDETVLHDETDYSSNQFRASKYLKQIKDLEIDSLLEVGPTHDFFLANQYHRNHVDVKLYYHDIVELNPPPWVKKIETLEGQYDLTLALHVLEHVRDPFEFVDMIDKISKYFIIEVPNCDEMGHKIRTTNQGHYHGYSWVSFQQLFSYHECKTIKRKSGTHSGQNPFVAYRLPEGVHIV
jgi:hypothetical protein